jgi:hypothetical protein
MSIPRLHPTTLLPLALSVAAAVALFGLFPPTIAQARKATCSSLSAGHPKRAAACTQSRHRSKANARPKPRAKGHHSKHATTKTKPNKTGTPSPKLPSPVAAVCEDGSGPVRASDGSFSCNDGSEPACEGDSSPVISRNGLTLVCRDVSSEGLPGEEVIPSEEEVIPGEEEVIPGEEVPS